MVLNACHTADPATATEAAQSLAAQLVAGGIPIVIGMTGEVADGACRLFTRGFYEALLSGAELPLAAARARRSAMLNYGNYDMNVEWSRLVFFARDWPATRWNVKGVNAAVPAAPTPAARIAIAATEYFPPHGQILCDRMECVRAYEQFRGGLVEGRAERVLALGVIAKPEAPGDQYSKTMLLDAIGVQAVWDGFIPCKFESDGKDVAANLLEFALNLMIEMDAARTRFGLGLAAASDVLCHALDVCQMQMPPAGTQPFKVQMFMKALRKKIRETDARDAALSADVITPALSADFERLADDTKKVLGVERPALVMIDDLHRYEGVAEPLLEEVIGHKDTPLAAGGRPVPLIFTYSQHDKDGGEIPAARTIKNFLKNKAGLVSPMELRPIECKEEQRLAYSQYLLTRKPPLAMTVAPAYRTHAELFFKTAQKIIKGVPSRFEDARLLPSIETFLEERILVEADDEEILAKYP